MPKIKIVTEHPADWPTVAQVAKAREVSARTVQRWIAAGHLRAVQVVAGLDSYLAVDPAVLATFVPRRVGAPAGNRHAAKKDAREKS